MIVYIFKSYFHFKVVLEVIFVSGLSTQDSLSFWIYSFLRLSSHCDFHKKTYYTKNVVESYHNFMSATKRSLVDCFTMAAGRVAKVKTRRRIKKSLSLPQTWSERGRVHRGAKSDYIILKQSLTDSLNP